MSVSYTNECVGCPPEMGCLGSACPNRNMAHYCCDGCGEEMDPEDLYEVDGDMLCKDCILAQYPKVGR